MRTRTWFRPIHTSAQIDRPNLVIGNLPGRSRPALYENGESLRVLAWFVDDLAAMRAQVLLGILCQAPVLSPKK